MGNGAANLRVCLGLSVSWAACDADVALRSDPGPADGKGKATMPDAGSEPIDGAPEVPPDAAPAPLDAPLADASVDVAPDYTWPSVDAPPEVQDPRCRPAGGACRVAEGELDAPPRCADRVAPTAFDPEIQWSWTNPIEPYSIVTPLVANLTDDNGDGSIDLCDIPDIVVVAYQYVFPNPAEPAHIYVLDGWTGAVHYRFQEPVENRSTPAVGDIDGDGLVEVVALGYGTHRWPLIAFEHDGTLKWVGEALTTHNASAVALADLDNDGDVEILADRVVVNHLGETLWTIPPPDAYTVSFTTMAADLDGDGDLEVLLGRSTYQHDGTEYWWRNGVGGYPHVANFDSDPEPEILVGANWLLESDGKTVWGPLNTDYYDVSVIHDFDGDGMVEFGAGAYRSYSLFETDGSVVWSAVTEDLSSRAGGSAFDFLGDGRPVSVYADEKNFFSFGPGGEVLYTMPRRSGTGDEYPVVADVDNDGSAEIVVVSSHNADDFEDTTPTVRVLRDKSECWVQARRIWNQHTYHVTNVREDGTIPQFEAPSWEGPNTFRANAPVTCTP